MGLRGKERHRKKKKKRRRQKKKKLKGHLGENSCAVVEVGIKNDAEQRGCFEEIVRSAREADEVQTAVKMSGGEPVKAVLGLKAQVRVCCTTERMAQQSRGSNLTALVM